MRRLLRIALLLLIALAIPVQGIAAASMVVCGPSHARMAFAAIGGPPHDHASHRHGVAPAGHDHAEVMNDGQHAISHTGPRSGKSESVQQFNQLAKFNCSACASCCTSVALPPTIVSLDLPKEHSVFLAVPVFGSATFLTAGLERPPRSSLA